MNPLSDELTPEEQAQADMLLRQINASSTIAIGRAAKEENVETDEQRARPSTRQQSLPIVRVAVTVGALAVGAYAIYKLYGAMKGSSVKPMPSPGRIIRELNLENVKPPQSP